MTEGNQNAGVETNFEQLREWLGKALGVPQELLAQLQEPAVFALAPDTFTGEGDWSLVVKSHAILEAAMSHLLSRHFHDDRLRSIFDHIELSNKKYGKMAFVKAMDLLPKPYRRFVAVTSELRNLLVHDIRNVTFSFESHMRGLSETEFPAFADGISLGAFTHLNPLGTPAEERDLFTVLARNTFLRTLLTVLQAVYLHAQTADLQRRMIDQVMAERRSRGKSG